MGTNPRETFDPKIAKLIKYKASRLVGSCGFDQHDVDDLQQDLSIQVWQGLQGHDPTRSKAITYASRIVDNKLATIVRHATAQKRDPRKKCAIDGIAEPPCATSSQLPSQRALTLDVTQAVEQLPEHLKVLAKLFMSFSMAEVIRRTGLSRQRIRTARKHIAEQFRAAGLQPDSYN